MTSRAKSRRLHRDNGIPRVFGNSQANALTAITTSGGKGGRTPVPGVVMEAGKALLEKSLAPFRNDLTRQFQAFANLMVPKTRCGKENNFGSDNITIR